MIVPVTAVIAAITGLLVLFLAARVAMYRRRHGIGMGHGDNREFRAAIRAHANLVEYAPIMLIMLAVGELNGVSAVNVYTVGLVFLVGRFLHAWGFIQSQGGYAHSRLLGVVLTWLAIVVMAVLLLVNVVRVA